MRIEEETIFKSPNLNREIYDIAIYRKFAYVIINKRNKTIPW